MNLRAMIQVLLKHPVISERSGTSARSHSDKPQSENNADPADASRLILMEQRVAALQKKLEEKEAQPTIWIETLNVEHLVVEQVDLNNNFGQLGIKELNGRLNIGTTYSAAPEARQQHPASGSSDNEPPGFEPAAQGGGNAATSPKVSMRARSNGG